ncbi:P-loop containing nucleoside triphosphate hydrolase protein, partial [Ephemerocybe angulata]
MGATGSGKTTFTNLVSGSAFRTSNGLRSCTDAVDVTEPFEVDGRRVVLVDTPGFDDTTKSDTDILTLIAEFLASSYQSGHKLTGLIFVHRISDFRIGGISLKNFRTFKKLCGEQTLRNVVIVTNMWSEVDPQLGETREHELATQDDFFKPALDKGAKIMRHNGSLESAKLVIQYILGNNPMALQIQRELVDERKDILQTAAADEIERELQAEKERQRVERERVRQEMEEAARVREEEMRRQREDEARRRQEKLDRIEADRRRVEENMERERREWEQRMWEEDQHRKRESERLQREFEERVAEERRRTEDQQRWQREEDERLRRELEWQRHRQRRHHGGCIV